MIEHQYKQRTFSIQPHQYKILETIKHLPQKRLHYLTIQQSNKHSNLTLPEMKRLVRSGIKKYIRRTNLNCRSGFEDKVIKYFGIFETTKDFFQSQHQNHIVDEKIDLGLHLHLFFSSVDGYSDVSFPSLISTIFFELTCMKHKMRCISKYDYFKIENLNDDFVLYHTKQFMYRPSSEMIMCNI